MSNTSDSESTSVPTSPALKMEAANSTATHPPKLSAQAIPTSARPTKGYTHRPPLLLLAWLVISMPLIAWDSLYVFLRPHTMPGGKLHSPVWTPYALYGAVDYIYGWPAWNNNVGFTAAQSTMNILESAFYCWYLYVVRLAIVDWSYGGLSNLNLNGKRASLAVLLCFSSAVMTVSKTVLYWLNDAFSGFENIGHNSAFNLIVIWIIPNGAWLVLPSYMIYVLGKDILEAMDASGN